MISNVIVTTIADILDVFGIPTNTASLIFNELLEKQKKIALDILFSEIRQGDFKNIARHEIVFIIARYLRDAMEGTAQKNLKLMAQVIHGMAKRNTLKSHIFLNFASILSVLTEDEIMLLGLLSKHGKCLLSAHKEINKFFPEEECIIILQRLLRTGLVVFKQGIEVEYLEGKQIIYDCIEDYKEVKTDFWTNYETTNLMEELLEYTNFII